MSKSKNNLTGITKSLTQGKTGRSVRVTSRGTVGATSPDLRTSTARPSIDTDSGFKSESSNTKSVAGIQFGKPSSNKTTASSTSDLSKLLKMGESTGISSLLGGGGGGLLGSLTRLGSIGSLIGGLFGLGSGTKTLPPLATFTLPQSTAASYSVGTDVRSSSGLTGSQQSSAIYSTPSNQIVTSASPSSVSSARITQAVKTALLSSSSLNDVINEL